MSSLRSPVTPISGGLAGFGSRGGAGLQLDASAVEKFAEFGSTSFDVKEWVNRELAGAKFTSWASNGPSAAVVKETLGATSAVAQQELDGFATTVLEEEEAKDASKSTDVAAMLPPGAQMTSEQLASSLVTKLQSMASEISGNIDKVCEDSIRNVPRVLYDLDAVRTEAGRIKATLKKAQQTFDTAAHIAVGAKGQPQQPALLAASNADSNVTVNGTSPISASAPALPSTAGPQTAFGALLSLDTVLSRMLQSLAALQETEHWATLGSEMASIFASGDLDRAATRLLEAQRSLSLLEQTAGYEERKQLLTDMMNQLEAEVVPKLVEAIEKRDIEGTKRMKGVLARMGRAGELFGRYYSAARKLALVELWKSWMPASSGNTELDIFLVEFYDAVLGMVTKELSWASGLFGDVVGAMHDLLGQVFASLEPKPDSRLSDFMSDQGPGAFPTLVHIYSTTASFASTMESLLSGFSESWSLPLLQPFVTYQSAYGVLEQRNLFSLLEDPAREYSAGLRPPPFTRDVSTSMEAYAETVQRVADSVVPFAFSTAEAAVARCEQLTFGFADPALLDSLDMFFQKVVRDGVGSVLSGVRKAAGMDDSTGSPTQQRQKLTMADGGEWEVFQLGLKILVVCAGLDKRFADFESGVLRPSLRKTATLLEIENGADAEVEEEALTPIGLGISSSATKLSSGKSPVNAQPASPTSKDSFDSVPQSALSILRRSPLNSAELRTLLASPPSPLISPPLEQLTRNAHRLVFDASFLPIQKEFAAFAGLPWNASEASPVSNNAANRRYGMMELPQFSLNPSPYITRIGEHLLTLPQQMELYQDDEGLCYRADLLPHLDLIRSQGAGGSTPRSPRNLEPAASSASPAKAALDDDLLTLPAAALYLTALSLGTQALFISSTTALPALSDKGAKQLSADAGYLANVVSALDVEILPSLRAIEDMCGCPSVEMAKKLESAVAEGCVKEEEEIRRRIVALRTGVVGQPGGRT